jgi:hypothetical protein
MPAECKKLFDEVWMRVQAIPTIKTLSQSGMYQVSVEHLPRMMMTAETDMPALGDPTAGVPKYEPTMTFYFSLVIVGNEETANLVELYATMDMVEDVLFKDPNFTRQVRGFPNMRRQNPNFSSVLETNVCEMRQSISFMLRDKMYIPDIPDYFKTLSVTAKPAPQVPGEGKPLPPTIYRQWEMFGGAVGAMRVIEPSDSVSISGNVTTTRKS